MSAPARPTRVVQIIREFGHGTGVGSVAESLEHELTALGYECERYTLEESGVSRTTKRHNLVASKLILMRDVVWFSTAGNRRARRRYADDPATVVISHADATYGDIFVNHGLLKKVMKDRHRTRFFVPKNPMHWYLLARDELRHRSMSHRYVVSLNSTDSKTLRALYPKVRSELRVIPNGIDLARFQIADIAEREEARGRLGFADDAHVTVFVGHEFDRKGLWTAVDALRSLPRRFRLLVVGGHDDMVRDAEARLARLGLTERVTLVGRQADPRTFLAAADSFVLPTAYEAAQLVLLEALSSGLPVITTASGTAPDVIVDGVNGWLVDRDGDAVATAIAATDAMLADEGRAAVAQRCQASVAPYAWRDVALQYAALIESVAAEHALRRSR